MVSARLGQAGKALHDKVRMTSARQEWYGKARTGCVSNRLGRQCNARTGRVGMGEAGMDRMGEVKQRGAGSGL